MKSSSKSMNRMYNIQHYLLYEWLCQYRSDSEHNKKVVGFVKEDIASSSMIYSECEVKREYSMCEVMCQCINWQDHLLSIGGLYCTKERTQMLQN